MRLVEGRVSARFATLLAVALLALGGVPRSAGQGTNQPPLRFIAHEIDTGLTGGYQVVIADLNRDGKPDIVGLASGLHELFWYENPGWKRHVIIGGVNAMINAAAFDIDGDGIPELALAHEFATVYARSLGVLSLLTHNADPTAPWSIREIDRVPTSHRLRWVNADGTGRKVLVNFPLIGAQSLAPDYRDHVSLFWYRPGDWTRRLVTDAEKGVVHGILPVAWDDPTREALLSSSFLGVHLLELQGDQWTRTRIVSGDPGSWPQSGTSDVVVGHLGTERFLAAIEPWHGNKVVVYRREAGGWARHVIDEGVTDGHTILSADFDNGGRDELIVGERAGQRTRGPSRCWTRTRWPRRDARLRTSTAIASRTSCASAARPRI